MKSIYENQHEHPPTNILHRDDLQDSLDFFYGRYLDYFPKNRVL